MIGMKKAGTPKDSGFSFLERAKRLELSTLSLGSLCPELAGAIDQEVIETPAGACTSACTPKVESLNETAPATPAGDGQDRGFAEAVRAVMALPLTDAEKAEAVRRLLAGAASRP